MAASCPSRFAQNPVSLTVTQQVYLHSWMHKNKAKSAPVRDTSSPKSRDYPLKPELNPSG